jgi:nitrite reductase (NADH) large subunit
MQVGDSTQWPLESRDSASWCKSLPASSGGRARLVVIGNGMVGQHFCKRALQQGLLERFEIAIFGEEPNPAYDRVNLGRIVTGGSLDDLTLEPRAWYERHGFEAHFGARATRIDRGERVVEIAGKGCHPYDWLVLATGSRALLPAVPGVELDGVLAYRTADDAMKLRAGALASIARSEPVIIAGGGLLGLELAEQLRELGATTVVVESAPHLLSRQLDPQAAALLQQVLETRDIAFHLGRRVSSIAPGTVARMAVRLSAGEELPAGLVVFAVGVRARDELARDAGLACDLFGGVAVDSGLSTTDARIFAIGECARWSGMSYGVVAPGYGMADVVVDRLLGRPSRFDGVEPAIRLELEAVEVSAIGESAVDGRDERVLVYRDERRYRRLTLRDGRVVGAAVIGPWEELSSAQQAIACRLALGYFEERRFRRGRRVWESRETSLARWPDEATVCTCMGVTYGALKRARAEGHRTLEALGEHTGAGTACGSCRPLVSSMGQAASPAPRSRAERALLASSIIALTFVLVWLAAPAIPYRESVVGFAYDTLWRRSEGRMLTGFALVGSLLIGSVLSLRKRLASIRFGTFARWRVFHAAASLAAAVLAVAHTGLRLGSNLDAALMATFLLATSFGALAGFAAALERALPPGVGPRLRERANRIHLYLVWPLPLLVTFHVLRFYYF